VKILANDGQTTNRISTLGSISGILFSVVFLDNLGFAIVIPYLYFYVVYLGGSAFVYGVLLASYSLMSFVFTPTLATLSDRFGRRKILLAALLISSLAYFIFGSAHEIWLLFLGRMLSGTTAATVPVAQAYVADVTIPSQRLKYLGLLGAAAATAFVLGPAIGGTLSSLFGYAVPSFLASALAFANLVLAYFRLPEPSAFNLKKTAISFSTLLDVLKKQKIALLLGVYFLFFAAFIFLQAALTPWLQKVFSFGSFQTGLVFFFVGGMSAFTQAVLLPALNKKISQLTLTLYSIGALAIGLLALAFIGNIVFMLAVTALISIGFGIQYVTLNTLISLNTPEYAQGGALGVAWAIAGLAQSVAPVFAASAFSFGVSKGFNGLVFAVSAIISLTTIPLFLAFKKVVKLANEPYIDSK
jgi:DHA1 family tetracycline resistance protein-like MFS transporter